MIHLIAEIKAGYGCESQVEQALKGLLEPSREEEGCCQYELYRDEKIEGLFVMQEIWCSEEALERHMQTEHFTRILSDLEQRGLVEYLNPRRIRFIA